MNVTATILDITVHVEPDYNGGFRNGEDGYCVYCSARLHFVAEGGDRIVGPRVNSPGLWGIDLPNPTDADAEAHLFDVACDEYSTLADLLRSLGFDDRDLATVPIIVNRKDV